MWVLTYFPELNVRADRLIAVYPVLGVETGGTRAATDRFVADSIIWARVEPGDAVAVATVASEHIARSVGELLALLAEAATRPEPLLYIVHRAGRGEDGATIEPGGRGEATPLPPTDLWEIDLFDG